MISGITFPLACALVSSLVSGVSYRLGDICIPSRPLALATWSGLLLALASFNGVIQISITAYCCWMILRDPAVHEPSSRASTEAIMVGDERGAAWQRTRSGLSLRWRDVATAFVLIGMSGCFAAVSVEQTAMSPGSTVRHGLPEDTAAWYQCLIRSSDGRRECLGRPTGLGMSESTVVISLLLTAVIQHVLLHALGIVDLSQLVGIIISLLMLHRSMFHGWWSLVSSAPTIRKRSHP